MTTIALDENWDIFADANGCLATVSDCDEIMQCIRQNILAVDWVSQFCPINQNIEAIEASIKSIVIGTEGVLAFTSFDTFIDNVNCKAVQGLNIQFSVLTTCGTINVGI